MRFLYVAPRYHTNQVPIIRGLKRKGHEVCFLSQYAGKVEDYSDLTPTVIGYSGFFLFFFNGEWVSGADAGLREKEMRWG